MASSGKRIYREEEVLELVNSFKNDGYFVKFDKHQKRYDICKNNVVMNHIYLQDSTDEEVYACIKHAIKNTDNVYGKEKNRYSIFFTKYFDGCRCTRERLIMLLHLFGAKQIAKREIYDKDEPGMKYISFSL